VHADRIGSNKLLNYQSKIAAAPDVPQRGKERGKERWASLFIQNNALTRCLQFFQICQLRHPHLLLAGRVQETFNASITTTRNSTKRNYPERKKANREVGWEWECSQQVSWRTESICI